MFREASGLLRIVRGCSNVLWEQEQEAQRNKKKLTDEEQTIIGAHFVNMFQPSTVCVIVLIRACFPFALTFLRTTFYNKIIVYIILRRNGKVENQRVMIHEVNKYVGFQKKKRRLGQRKRKKKTKKENFNSP